MNKKTMTFGDLKLKRVVDREYRGEVTYETDLKLKKDDVVYLYEKLLTFKKVFIQVKASFCNDYVVTDIDNIAMIHCEDEIVVRVIYSEYDTIEIRLG